MTLPIQTITQNATRSWTFTWADTGALSYRVVLSGVQLAVVTTPTYTWNGTSFLTFPPPLEITDQDTPVLSEQFQPYLIIQWYGESQAKGYTIQQSVDSGVSYNTIAVFQESGSWVYTWQTPTLKDESTYLYRVIAVDFFGNESPARHYQIYVVTPPGSPDALVKIDYTNPNIIVSAI